MRFGLYLVPYPFRLGRRQFLQFFRSIEFFYCSFKISILRLFNCAPPLDLRQNAVNLLVWIERPISSQLLNAKK